MNASKERSSGSIKRKVLISLVAVLTLWFFVAAWLLGTAWYSVTRYEPSSTPAAVDLILSDEAYGELIDAHARPYAYEFRTREGGRVLVFGAEHTVLPEDPQLDEVRSRWNGLLPTVALIEGDLGMLFPAFMDPVHTFGETGYVHALARAASVATYSWDPSAAIVLQDALDQGFAREQVALRWILDPYFSNLRHGRPENPEGFVRDTLGERCQAPCIAGALTTMEDVNTAWERAFPEGPDWRTVSDQYGLPGFLAEMDLNRVRDIHLVACLAELVEAGERVFVICGSSHAVKIEPALAAQFE